METMIEKVAKALRPYLAGDGPDGSLDGDEIPLAAARAAIEAMRESPAASPFEDPTRLFRS